MLARNALHPRNASTARSLVRPATLIVARNNATAATTVTALADQPSPVVHAPPVRKSKIPITQTFGDLAIPARGDAKQFAGGRGSTLGTHRLSQNQFAGRGSLSGQLLKRRAAQASSSSPKNAQRLTVDGVTLATPPELAGTPSANAKNKATQETPAKAKRGKKSEITMMEQLPNKTNFAELFNAPSPAGTQVVSLNLAQGDGKVSSHRERMLERTIGDYSRYLPPTLGSVPGNTMERIGAFGYAQLALGRARGSTLKQKQSALAIVSRLIGTGPRASRSVNAS